MQQSQTDRKRGTKTGKIQLSPDIKQTYSEIIPVLSGHGKQCALTLLERRRDDPDKLDQLLTQPWKANDPISIVWKQSPSVSSHPS